MDFVERMMIYGDHFAYACDEAEALVKMSKTAKVGDMAFLRSVKLLQSRKTKMEDLVASQTPKKLVLVAMYYFLQAYLRILKLID